MLFTGKGDKGATKFFGACERSRKDDARAEALGTVDELNSLLGVVKSHISLPPLAVGEGRADARDITEAVQQDLFVVQAELADITGVGGKTVSKERVSAMEEIINAVEAEIPPLKHFTVPGSTKASALFDYARAVARRAERRVVALHEEAPVSEHLLAYVNRLSSLLFALARFAAHAEGAEEKKPHY